MDTDVEPIDSFEKKEENELDVLDLSTAHYNPLTDEGTIKEHAIMEGEHGYLVYPGVNNCPSRMVLEGDVSKGLQRTLETARQAGYRYILFDRDAREHPDLPMFKDEWDEGV